MRKNSDNPLAELIINSYEDSSKLSCIGQELISRAKEILFKKEEIDSETVEQVKKFELYREYEETGNLLRISYYSFNLLGLYSQAKIKLNLDPLMWSAVYVSKEDFLNSIEVIFDDLPPDISCQVIKSGQIFDLLSFDLNPRSSRFSRKNKPRISKKVVCNILKDETTNKLQVNYPI